MDAIDPRENRAGERISKRMNRLFIYSIATIAISQQFTKSGI